MTRYRVRATLGPHSAVLLIRPEDRLVITGWCAGDRPRHLDGDWVSPQDNLELVLRGDEISLIQLARAV